MKNFDRNKCFFLAILVLLVGGQFRLVERVVLTRQVTERLAEHQAPNAAQASKGIRSLWPSAGPTIPGKVITPPRWIGLALLSVGAVLLLQSFVLPGSNE